MLDALFSKLYRIPQNIQTQWPGQSGSERETFRFPPEPRDTYMDFASNANPGFQLLR